MAEESEIYDLNDNSEKPGTDSVATIIAEDFEMYNTSVLKTGEDTSESETDSRGRSWLYDCMGLGQKKIPIIKLEKERNYYMRNEKRGICLILNQDKFDGRLKVCERKGTNIDKDSLKNCFESLCFDVDDRTDLEKRDIEKLLLEVSQKKDYLEKSDCFVCCVMTHGNDGILCARDAKYSTDLLFKNFKSDKCPELAGKPKIFFIQACRGKENEKCQFGKGTKVMVQMERADSSDVRTIPTEADFMIVYSTVSGYYSIRETTGSWFMQSLCSVLNEFGNTEDLMSMMTMVNNCVALDYPTEDSKKTLEKVKQIPMITSTLTRKVYFPVN